MIDINELRISVEAAEPLLLMARRDALELLELLDRLEAAEKERDNANAAAAGIALQAERLEAERDALLNLADKFGDGIDWIQRAMQVEAEIGR